MPEKGLLYAFLFFMPGLLQQHIGALLRLSLNSYPPTCNNSMIIV